MVHLVFVRIDLIECARHIREGCAVVIMKAFYTSSFSLVIILLKIYLFI